jgi:hypothetical protein
MAITYFGNCDPSTGAGTGASYQTGASELEWFVAGYACPGSGPQDIKTLGAECAYGTGNIRLGIYDGTTLVVETNSEKAAGTGARAWTSWDNTELTWAVGTTLTGGKTYIIVVAGDANYGPFGTNVVSGAGKYYAGDYTGGMIAILPAGSNFTNQQNVRCGVEAAAGVGLAGTVAGVSTTSSLLPYIYHYLVDNVVAGVSSIPTLLPYITHRLLPETVSIVSTVVGDFTLWSWRTFTAAVNGVSTLFGNLTKISGALNKLRIYMKIHGGRH